MAYSKKKKMEELDKMKQKILKRTLPYMVEDSGATLSCRQIGDLFIAIGIPTTKTFYTPLDRMTQVMETAQLHTQVR